MPIHQDIQQVKIVYFSGTGGTKKAAELLAAAFTKEDKEVRLVELRGKELEDRTKEDRLIVIFPVYAFNAPKPVYEYIRSLPMAAQVPAAVISVSGGGEVGPNKSSRRHCIRLLEQKGYRVVYEEMLVMPSNIFVNTPDELSMYLLKVLPVKVQKIAADMLSGVTRRIRPNTINRLLSDMALVEQLVSKLFAKQLKISDSCSGCGLCASSCPRGNICMENNRPVFHNRCVICLKCVYDCPKAALKPGILGFAVIKQGYSLTELYKRCGEEACEDFDTVKIENLTKGYLFSGLKKYLLGR